MHMLYIYIYIYISCDDDVDGDDHDVDANVLMDTCRTHDRVACYVDVESSYGMSTMLMHHDVDEP